MAFSIGSPFSPPLPSPYRSTFIGVDPVMVMPVTRDATATPDAIVVSPAEVLATPPILKFFASENANRAFGVGYDAAASPVDVSSVCPSQVTFSWAIWLSLQENSQSVIFTPWYVNGCTVTPEICGRPTCVVSENPALLPLVCICLYAVPSTTTGVVTVEPRACFHHKHMLCAGAAAGDWYVCSLVGSPLT